MLQACSSCLWLCCDTQQLQKDAASNSHANSQLNLSNERKKKTLCGAISVTSAEQFYLLIGHYLGDNWHFKCHTKRSLKCLHGISLKRWTDSPRHCRWPSQQLDDRLFFQWTQIWFHKPEKYPEAAANPYSHTRHLKVKTETNITNRFPKHPCLIPNPGTGATGASWLLTRHFSKAQAHAIKGWNVLCCRTAVYVCVESVWLTFLHFLSNNLTIFFIFLNKEAMLLIVILAALVMGHIIDNTCAARIALLIQRRAFIG